MFFYVYTHPLLHASLDMMFHIRTWVNVLFVNKIDTKNLNDALFLFSMQRVYLYNVNDSRGIVQKYLHTEFTF